MPDSPLDLYSKIKDQLDSDTRFAVYDGKVPSTPTAAYVVLYPDPGIASKGRLVAAHRPLQWNLRAVCVGKSTSQCMNTVRLVRDLLAGWRPDEDKSVSPLNEQDNQAVLFKDESDLQDIRWSYTLHYRIHTNRS